MLGLVVLAIFSGQRRRLREKRDGQQQNGKKLPVAKDGARDLVLARH